MRKTILRIARWCSCAFLLPVWIHAPAWAADELIFAVARLPLSLPVYVAEEQGYLAKEGVALKILDCDVGRRCLDHLLGGAADIATVADSPIVFASLRGARFKLVATMSTARNYSKIVTRPGSGIARMADLRGKRVGTLLGTSAQYFLDLSLMLAEIDVAQVTVAALESGEAAAALSGGKVDALAIFEPYAFQAARLLGPDARVLTDARVHRENWNLAATDKAVRERGAMLGRLCRALARAEKFIAEDPVAARAILRRRLAVEEQAIDWVWSDLQFRLQLSQSLIASLEGQARWAIRSGYAPGPAPNYLAYIHTDAMAGAKPGAVTVGR